MISKILTFIVKYFSSTQNSSTSGDIYIDNLALPNQIEVQNRDVENEIELANEEQDWVFI